MLNTVLEVAKVLNVKVNYADIKQQVLEVIELEVKIASLTQNKEVDNLSNLYKVMTVNELQLWSELISIKRNNTVRILRSLFIL